jgi:hypothetical protein
VLVAVGVELRFAFIAYPFNGEALTDCESGEDTNSASAKNGKSKNK